MHSTISIPWSSRGRRRGLGAAGVAFLTLLTLSAWPAWGHADAGVRPGPDAFHCDENGIGGVPEADALTAVSIVCDELARLSGRQGRFEVTVRPLGAALVLSVRRLPEGEVRSLTLHDLDETPAAATRLAEALILDRPIEETRRVGNLLAAETRRPREIKGNSKWALGVAGMGLSGRDTGTGAGFSIARVHETPSWAALAELTWASAPGNGRSADLFAFGAGVRRYLSHRDAAPFVGAGMEYLSLSIDHYDGNRSDSAHGKSLAPYVEGGVQLMRLSRARVTAGVRVHVPTASLEREVWEWDASCYYDCGHEPTRSTEYVVPVTFGLSVAF